MITRAHLMRSFFLRGLAVSILMGPGTQQCGGLLLRTKTTALVKVTRILIRNLSSRVSQLPHEDWYKVWSRSAGKLSDEVANSIYTSTTRYNIYLAEECSREGLWACSAIRFIHSAGRQYDTSFRRKSPPYVTLGPSPVSLYFLALASLRT